MLEEKMNVEFVLLLFVAVSFQLSEAQIKDSKTEKVRGKVSGENGLYNPSQNELIKSGKIQTDNSESNLFQDKRGIGRWLNFQYMLRKHKPLIVNVKNNEEKRHIGRWLNRNWLAARRMNNRNHNLHFPFSSLIEKRSPERLRNENFLLSKFPQSPLSGVGNEDYTLADSNFVVGKRFIGRWNDRDYFLSRLGMAKWSPTVKRFPARWKLRNWLLARRLSKIL